MGMPIGEYIHLNDCCDCRDRSLLLCTMYSNSHPEVHRYIRRLPGCRRIESPNCLSNATGKVSPPLLHEYEEEAVVWLTGVMDNDPRSKMRTTLWADILYKAFCALMTNE
ncbi:hypothetical protein AMECASPLE_038261 [Ameca splendens]|uniref:Uncharacterized protein n=1 Tax=Ameca splendens TaxID=208324 RepID=A0ABV1A3K4_9TELE